MLRRLFGPQAKPEPTASERINTGFQHDAAQVYEFESGKRFIRENYPHLLEQWRTVKREGGLWHHPSEHWFEGDQALWNDFRVHVQNRKCLEIGSGPLGTLAGLWWVKDRVIIDPLVSRYREYEIELCGESWFTDDMRLINAPGETIVPDLVGAVDGCIVCRNALDHCDDPLNVLYAISQYAAPGCWLLLWTDIWHLRGVDAGHHNITKSPAVFDALLRGFGFDIVKNSQLIRSPDEYIEYGRIAKKLASAESTRDA